MAKQFHEDCKNITALIIMLVKSPLIENSNILSITIDIPHSHNLGMFVLGW